jgi:membrane protein implicated in regulation of membrane protease activity
MRKHAFLLILGVLVFVVPFLGIPETWRATILFSLGALIIVMGLMFRFSARQRERKDSEIYYEENEPRKGETIEPAE